MWSLKGGQMQYFVYLVSTGKLGLLLFTTCIGFLCDLFVIVNNMSARYILEDPSGFIRIPSGRI